MTNDELNKARAILAELHEAGLTAWQVLGLEIALAIPAAAQETRADFDDPEWSEADELEMQEDSCHEDPSEVVTAVFEEVRAAFRAVRSRNEE